METFNQFVWDNWMLFVLIFFVLIGASEGLKYLMTWTRDAAQRQAENDLKREMIQRGMSADEIVRVLQGTSPDRTESKRLANLNHLTELGKALAIHEVSSPIMEAIMSHFAAIPEAHQPAAYSSIQEMIESSVDEKSILAAVSSMAKAYSGKLKNVQTEVTL